MPKTTHDFMRDRLLAQAGIFDPLPLAPSLDEIANLAMIEFATHPDYPFNLSDDGEHTARKR